MPLTICDAERIYILIIFILMTCWIPDFQISKIHLLGWDLLETYLGMQGKPFVSLGILACHLVVALQLAGWCQDKMEY